MEVFELALLLLGAVLISSVADRIIPKVSSPLIQIALGILIVAMAGKQIDITFDNELFLVLFIAPLLYDEARQTDKVALMRNIKPVLGLAIGLVLITTIALGFFTNEIIPSIPLAACFALAAALGPTDAVAVGSLPKNIDIGERKHNTLKGEYLLNDASGIVAFQFAIALMLTGTFDPTQAALEFAISFIGGIIVGVISGALGNAIAKYVREIGIDNTTFHVLFDLFIPFIIYLASEQLGVSGIIACVAGGLARSFDRSIGTNPSRLSIVSNSVWQVLSYALNGIIFVLLGTQLPKLMQGTWDSVAIDNGLLIGYIVATTAILLAIRFIWLAVSEYLYARKKARKSLLKPKDAGVRFFGKTTMQGSLIMTLAGPKGAVTLSLILTIPLTISDGTPFPQRDLIIFIACGVILITLLLSNFLLPVVAPKVTVSAEKEAENEQYLDAFFEVQRIVIETLTARQTKENAPATQSVVKMYNERIDRVKNDHGIESEQDLQLRLKAFQYQIDYLKESMRKGDITRKVGEECIARIERSMDIHQRHESREFIHRNLRRLRNAWLTMKAKGPDKLPGISPNEHAQAVREATMRSISHTISKMRDNMAESPTPSEDISKLIGEYQRNLVILRAKNPSLTAISKVSIMRDTILLDALRIESEAIQDMYDDKRINRAVARRLQNNVRLMRVEFEDDELS